MQGGYDEVRPNPGSVQKGTDGKADGRCMAGTGEHLTAAPWPQQARQARQPVWKDGGQAAAD